MPEDITDVKETTEGSSPDVAATGATEEVVKETPASTTEHVSQADLDKGFAAAVMAGAEKVTSKEPEGKEEPKADEAKETSEDTKTEDTTETKVEDKGPIPYDRFKEVNEAKLHLEEQLKAVEPFVAAQKRLGEFFIKNNLQNEEIDFWLNVAANYKNNPEQALKMLEPHFQQLQSYKGEVLPPELQKAVDEGEMSVTWAKKLAQAENKTKFSQQQTKLTQEQIQQQESQRFVNEVQVSMHNWNKTKMAGDPDFKPKTNGESDGKFELVQKYLLADFPQSGARTVDDIVAFAEKTYETVNKMWKKNRPQVNGIKTVKSTQSLTSARSESPNSFEEAAAQGARKAGVNFNPLRK